MSDKIGFHKIRKSFHNNVLFTLTTFFLNFSLKHCGKSMMTHQKKWWVIKISRIRKSVLIDNESCTNEMLPATCWTFQKDLPKFLFEFQGLLYKDYCMIERLSPICIDLSPKILEKDIFEVDFRRIFNDSSHFFPERNGTVPEFFLQNFSPKL